VVRRPESLYPGLIECAGEEIGRGDVALGADENQGWTGLSFRVLFPELKSVSQKLRKG